MRKMLLTKVRKAKKNNDKKLVFLSLGPLACRSPAGVTWGRGGGEVGGGWVARVGMEGGICSFPILPLLFNPLPVISYSLPILPLS